MLNEQYKELTENILNDDTNYESSSGIQNLTR